MVTVIALAAGCGGTSGHGVKGASTTLRHCVPGSRNTVGSRDAAWAAVVVRRTNAFRAPGRRPFAVLEPLNANRVPTVLGVIAQQVDRRCRATWLDVELPLRPNEVTGWVRAAHVQREVVHTRITVDLSEKRVRLYERGRLVLSSRAAIGSSATPTPLGRYYVNQRLIPDDPSGPFGPGAVGISAFSPVLTGWAQGGPIAIHGTNEPWSIGRAVSNGCIRLPNRTLRRLFARAMAGTPVLIKR